MTYTPKPGDSVKATLGDSVLYGTIHAIDSDHTDYVELVPEGDDAHRYQIAVSSAQWTFEPWTKPVKFKPLTVVKFYAGAVLDFDDDEAYQFERDATAYRNQWGGWWGTALRNNDIEDWALDETIPAVLAAGKAEILFEGVDG